MRFWTSEGPLLFTHEQKLTPRFRPNQAMRGRLRIRPAKAILRIRSEPEYD